jgi:hypothetical protein
MRQAAEEEQAVSESNPLTSSLRQPIGETEELPEEIKQKARLTVCCLAKDSADAALLLAMLGLTPDKEPEHRVAHCKQCGAPMSRHGVAGHKKTGANGLCRGCTDRERKASAKPPRRYVRSAPSTTSNPGRCKQCDIATAPKREAKAGEVRYGGRGLCERCYRAVRRTERGESVNVPADESRDRLWEMKDAGMTNLEMAAATGLSDATISVLLYGVKGKHRKTVTRETHDRIMATPIRQVAS